MASIAGNRGGSRKPKIQEKKGFVNLKINIRLLPPNLTEDLFYEQLSNYTTALKDGSITEKYYVKGSYPEKPYERPIYSRAYLLFKNQNTMAQFVKELTNRPFIEPQSNDSMIPMIGNALYHRMPGPSQTPAKIAENALENDDIYKEFLLFLDGKVADFNVIKATRKTKKKKRDRKRKEKKVSEKAKVEKPTSDKKGANNEVTDQQKSKSKAKRRRKSKKDKKGNETEPNSNQGGENVDENKDKDQTGTVDKPKKAKKPRKRKKKTANTDNKPSDQLEPPLQDKEENGKNKTPNKDQDKPTPKKPKSKKKKNKNPEGQKDQAANSESKSANESTPTPKPKPKPKKKNFKNNKPPTNPKLE